MHDVQANEAVRLGVEGLRHRPHDGEAEVTPQGDRSGVRLDHGVELHCGVALFARPLQSPLAKQAADIRRASAIGSIAYAWPDGRCVYVMRDGDDHRLASEWAAQLNRTAAEDPKDVVLVIDVQGARQVRTRYAHTVGVFAVYIGVQLVRFAKPPTIAVTTPATAVVRP